MNCRFCNKPHEMVEFYATIKQIQTLNDPPNREIDESCIAALIANYTNNGLPIDQKPIHLMFGLNGELYLLDGQDRLVAACQLNRENIKAITHPFMDRNEIIDLRFRANDENGRGHTRQERIQHGIFLHSERKLSIREAAERASISKSALDRAISKESGGNGRKRNPNHVLKFVKSGWSLYQEGINQKRLTEELADLFEENPQVIEPFEHIAESILAAVDEFQS